MLSANLGCRLCELMAIFKQVSWHIGKMWYLSWDLLAKENYTFSFYNHQRFRKQRNVWKWHIRDFSSQGMSEKVEPEDWTQAPRINFYKRKRLELLNNIATLSYLRVFKTTTLKWNNFIIPVYIIPTDSKLGGLLIYADWFYGKTVHCCSNCPPQDGGGAPRPPLALFVPTVPSCTTARVARYMLIIS